MEQSFSRPVSHVICLRSTSNSSRVLEKKTYNESMTLDICELEHIVL